MEDDRSKALQLISVKGPVIPANISKELGKNLLFTSVILSELVRAKKLKVSHVKIGGSPLYFLPHQKERLENFYRYLNEKDRRTFDILKEKRVLRESDLDPLTKVSLSNLKDFAVPLDVTVNNEKEIFWKFHSSSQEEATEKIRAILIKKAESGIEKKEEIPERLEEKKDEKVEPVKNIIEEEKEKAEPDKVEEIKREEKKEEADIKKEKPEEKTQKKEPEKKVEKIVSEKEKKIDEYREEPEDEFYEEIKKEFSKKGIDIVSAEIVRKKSDIEMIVNIDSGIGKLKYYCRCKKKKRINDSDIASAFIQAQAKKLPLLFATTGEPTKKTEEMMDKEFESVKLIRI